jgi:hypothetical protein
VDIHALKARAAQIIQEVGLATVSTDWSGCDAVWTAFEEMSKEGATVVIKIDGQRTSPEDNGRYTVLVSGGPLGEEFFRLDTSVLEDGLAKAILFYAEKCWKLR